MRALILAVGLGGLIPAGPLAAQDPPGDPQAGRQVANMCRTCHGLDGYAQVPIAPHIGGEPATYLSAQLRAFRSGEREHEMMSVVAKNLTDEQIANVAAWYASHTATAVLPDGFDAAAAPTLCSDCHGADGIAVVADAPHLAGENRVYLETQLNAFRTGQRTHDIMTPIATELTDGELREVADWFASIELEIAGP
ncbi:c-type cytochrome [uncultured Paracoccus sp.]|uniref:c-type cytochrome n=1 Tax=uncultured Paracoccus sp. TaxID=189685 RepID=UPI002624CAF5|nr:c-type cytochrome [uncultured Paracoccus sp.]